MGFGGKKMTFYYFSKAELDFETVLIVFEQGCLGKPVCILDKDAIKRLKEEWNIKKECE